MSEPSVGIEGDVVSHFWVFELTNGVYPAALLQFGWFSSGLEFNSPFISSKTLPVSLLKH